jgi:gluconokinase
MNHNQAGHATRHLVMMGVAGVGKTTVACQLAGRLGYELVEGDDIHPSANVTKMANGIPLDDADRMPWLGALAERIRERDRGGTSTVVTCSALRRRYRDVLRRGADTVYFVHLVGKQKALLARMVHREHFMPPALLQSQFDTLEPLEDDEAGVRVETSGTPETVVAAVLHKLALS